MKNMKENDHKEGGNTHTQQADISSTVDMFRLG